MRRRPAAARTEVLRRPASAREQAGGPGRGPLVETGSRVGWARQQYAWAITFAHPYEETVQRVDLRTPSSFTRQEFLDAALRCHLQAGVRLEEAAVFLEHHKRRDSDGDRVPRLNVIVRAGDKFTWRTMADKFWEIYRVSVDFSENMRTWFDCVVYFTVASMHKQQDELDTENYIQWALNGRTVSFSEVLPSSMNARKCRHPRLQGCP